MSGSGKPLTIILPVDEVIGDLKAVLRNGQAAVLVAPPGAGKTTRVPLALMDEDWVCGRAGNGEIAGKTAGKIIVLEPRRLAARASADRMAQILGEPLGQTIGLRARLQSKTSPANRGGTPERYKQRTRQPKKKSQK